MLDLLLEHCQISPHIILCTIILSASLTWFLDSNSTVQILLALGSYLYMYQVKTFSVFSSLLTTIFLHRWLLSCYVQSNYWKQILHVPLTQTWEHKYLAYFWSPTWCCPSNGKILKNLEKLHDSKLLVYMMVF